MLCAGGENTDLASTPENVVLLGKRLVNSHIITNCGKCQEGRVNKKGNENMEERRLNCLRGQGKCF